MFQSDNQIQFPVKPPFESFDNQPHNQKPPSRNVHPKKEVDHETWTIDFGRIFRNTVIDLRYGTAGQSFENAVSIRKFARPNTFSDSPGISSCSSSPVRSAHGAGSRRAPNDLSKDFQLFSDPESPCCAGSLFPSENDGSNGKNEQKRKTPKKSRFVNSQTIKESPLIQQDEFSRSIISVVVKKPTERRVVQTTFYEDAPFSNSLGREGGPRNWELGVLPVEAASTTAGGSSVDRKGMSWKDKTDLSPTQLATCAPISDNDRLTLEENLERLLERSSLRRGGGLLLEFIPLCTFLIFRQPINPVNGNLHREPPWHGKKTWFLESAELHETALVQLEDTKYHHWTGIAECLQFFQSIRNITFPLADPRRWLININNERIRIYSSPTEPLMLAINRLTKGIWQFVKSMRIFVRAAVSFRTSGDPEAYQNDFWIQSPIFSSGVWRFLELVLRRKFGIQCFPVDQNGNFPPQQNTAFSGFMANLLGDQVRCERYDGRCDMLMEIYEFMFGLSVDEIQEMIAVGELINPPMVSFKYPLAMEYDEMLHDGVSPAVVPVEGNDLGDMSGL